MDVRSALLIGSHSDGGIPLPVINCTRWRAPEGKPACSVMGSPTVADCGECAWRKPIVGRHRWRGLGDVVAAVVYVLCLGRPRIAERLAGVRPRLRNLIPEKPGVSGRCGCKKRQAALNRAIPFQRNAH